MERNFDYCLLYYGENPAEDNFIKFHLLVKDKSTERYSEVKSSWSIPIYDSPSAMGNGKLIELVDAKLTTDKFVKLIIECYNNKVNKCSEFSAISPEFKVNKNKGEFIISFVKIHAGDMTMRTHSSSDKDEIEERHVSIKKLIELLQIQIDEIVKTVEDNYKYISEVRSHIEENKALDRDVDFLIMTDQK